MFKIDSETKIIRCTRGDKGIIEFNIPISETEFYKFKKGDVISFGVYPRKKLEDKPVIYKEVTVETETESVDIELTSMDTTIGEIINKEVDYWYEIELNNEQTIIGYDDEEDEKGKIFRLLPEGSK